MYYKTLMLIKVVLFENCLFLNYNFFLAINLVLAMALYYANKSENRFRCFYCFLMISGKSKESMSLFRNLKISSPSETNISFIPSPVSTSFLSLEFSSLLCSFI